MNKYSNVKTIIDGIKFDSKLEANFYKFFKERGISILELQPRYTLQEKFTHNGKTIRPIEYIADFKILYNGDEIVIDAKGMATPVFKIKQKMMLRVHPDVNFITLSSVKALRTFIDTYGII